MTNSGSDMYISCRTPQSTVAGHIFTSANFERRVPEHFHVYCKYGVAIHMKLRFERHLL